jgi:hypothetical protein
MDLNVKLQGINYNLKKFRGVFAKFQALTIFQNYQIIFQLKILWNRSTQQ